MKETSLTHDIPMEVKLAYRNTGDLDDDWHLIRHSKVKKEFTCTKGNFLNHSKPFKVHLRK